MTNVIESLESKVQLLGNWFKDQQHLPEQIENILLKRFVYVANGDLEAAKKRLENNYKLRNENLDIFLSRDPFSEEIKNLWKRMNVVYLPGLTLKNCKVVYSCLDDAQDWDFRLWLKGFFLMNDLRQVTEDPKGFTTDEVIIFDLSVVGFSLMSKMYVSLLKVLFKYTQELNPVTYKEIHYVNCPSIVRYLSALLNPFTKREIREIIHMHQPGSETLHEFVPKDMLPEELGGSAGKLSDMKNKWIEMLNNKRDYVIDEKYWKMNSK